MNQPASSMFDQPQEDRPPVHHPWLERYLWVIAVVTFFLIILGGTVTSKDAGLAVPDWPHTFGYNMLTYPPSQWVGGVFWEHTHRLLATLVGFLGLILLCWVMITPRLLASLRILGAVIFVLVCIQGLMGGLRVTEVSTALGVVHGVTGQLFFALLLITCIMAGKPWLERKMARGSCGRCNYDMRGCSSSICPECGHDTRQDVIRKPQPSPAAIAKADQGISTFTLACVFLGVLVIQLALGASMRHYKAGLAIPDFPTSYGQLVPPMTVQGIERAMDSHAGGQHNLEGYYSPMKVSVHFAHRLWAVAVLVAAFALISIMGSRKQLDQPGLFKLAMAIVALLLVQVMLGAFVIWSGRHPEVATAHQTTGALILGIATVLMMQVKIHTQPVTGRLEAPSVTSAEPGPDAGGRRADGKIAMECTP